MAFLRRGFENISQIGPRKSLVILIFACASASILGFFMPSVQGWLLLGALIAFSLLLLTLIWPEAATLFFIFITYINLVAVLSRHHDVPVILGAGTSVILVIPIVSYVVVQRKPLVFPLMLPLMIIYLLTMIISTLLSEHLSVSIAYISTVSLEGVALCLLVSNVIRTSATLRRVTWFLLLAGSLMGALSIYQELTHSYRNDFGGFAQVDTAAFKVGEDLYGKVLRPRLAGPIGEKNRYAQVMLVLFPLALFRFWGEKSRRLRILAAGSAVLILGATILTFSRGALVALFVLMVVMIVLRYIRLHQAILVSLIFVVLIVVVAPDYVIRVDSLRRVQSLFSDDTGESAPDGAIVGRLTENLAALNTFLDHPVWGVGPGQYFKDYSMKYANALNMRLLAKNRRAHSLYLEIAADTGLIGLSAFMAIVVVTMVQLWRLRRYWLYRRPDSANMLTAFFLSVVAYLASGVFLHLSYQRYYWLLLTLANSAIYVYQRETMAAESLDRLTVEKSETRSTSLPGDRLLLPSYRVNTPAGQE